MGHQTMLNPELEDHAGGDLGYLNSLCNRLFCFGQEPTPDIRNNTYFRRFGLAALFREIFEFSKNYTFEMLLKLFENLQFSRNSE